MKAFMGDFSVFTVFPAVFLGNAYLLTLSLVNKETNPITRIWVKKKFLAMPKRKTIIEIISALFILLWVYAAMSKLIDFETFKVQLGKSPLLTSFAGFAAVAVPISELVIAGMLLINRFKLFGLYASLFMIAVFTAYIIAILNFSYYIPCSCGGILSSLGWFEHVIFNLVFVVLAIMGIVMYNGKQKTNKTLDYTPSLEMK